jgi:lysozyme
MSREFHAPGLMEPSADCIALVKEFEGLQLHAYDDGVGNWTIGWGHTRGVHRGQRISEQDAEIFLKQDLEEAARDVRQFIEVPLTQGMFDALTSFDFNLGAFNLRRSTLRKLINERDYILASHEFQKWDMAGHHHLPGLERRRDAEAALFLK